MLFEKLKSDDDFDEISVSPGDTHVISQFCPKIMKHNEAKKINSL